jgi:hypothetical protein
MALKKACVLGLAATILSLSFNVANARPKEVPKKVTEQEAMDLVGTMYGPSVGEGGFDVTEPDDFNGFYLVADMGPEAGIADWWAVNPWTGDIWSVQLCFFMGPVTSPEIRATQAKFKARFSQAELKEYTRLHRLEPTHCMNDDYHGDDLPVVK